ncbi:MAG TPA: glutamate carboxypeptidase [Xanthobacteraceae bacterium]|nr:glutamate carboxypeptidase [Xanthobacteraceae bacterium]
MTNSFPATRYLRHSIASAAIAMVALGATGAPACAEPNKQILERAQQHKDGAIKLWERLVNIDSQTGDEEGLKAVGAIATEELGKLGARIETVPAAKPAVGDNIVASFSGTGKGKVLLIAHMDTVLPKGTAAARPFRIKDGRATGPGVSDNKGGIIAALYALRILQDLNFKDYAQITLLLNCNEETGSLGTRLLIEKLAKEHDVTLNLESGRPGDGLVVWRKGSGLIKVEVKGRAAHAGVAPDSGRNAAMELAHQILQLGKLGNREIGTTVNFTVLKSGDRHNVIPDHATAQGDVRALSSEEFDRIEKELAAVSQNKLIPDTEVTTSLTRLFPPMALNAQTQALVAMAQSIYGELGRKLTLEGSGGAADSSLSAGVFKPTLDGLGLIGGNAHSLDEYAEPDSFEPRLYLLTRMVMELGKSGHRQ